VRASTGNDAVRVSQLELVDRDSVDALVGDWDGPLDILVNNAGVMAIPELELSPDGHEMQFATNHLGHFRLALGLHDALAAAPPPAPATRWPRPGPAPAPSPPPPPATWARR